MEILDNWPAFQSVSLICVEKKFSYWKAVRSLSFAAEAGEPVGYFSQKKRIIQRGKRQVSLPSLWIPYHLTCPFYTGGVTQQRTAYTELKWNQIRHFTLLNTIQSSETVNRILNVIYNIHCIFEGKKNCTKVATMIFESLFHFQKRMKKAHITSSRAFKLF